ncbi:hypothetical protein L596_012489 [Steinernema carpocapsae]|uniref:Uncharacterized protein n=1 Tax=Steinernema carpocapsae TaxID=34508 RepID=A0A4U5NX85_STECR|nr:hypothetical protein L596_012489 [Steinernema carpocapsae]
MMDQAASSLSLDQIRQLMALQGIQQQPPTTTSSVNPYLMLQDQGSLNELLLQQQLQQQQLAALAAAQNQSAFRRPQQVELRVQRHFRRRHAAFSASLHNAQRDHRSHNPGQPSARHSGPIPDVPTHAAGSTSSASPTGPNAALQSQQQMLMTLHAQQLMQQAQELIQHAQRQTQPEPMQVSATPTTTSSPQLSTSPQPRKRAFTEITRLPPKVAHKQSQKVKKEAEGSMLNKILFDDDDEEEHRPNSAPNSNAKRRSVDPDSPDRHHPKNLEPSDPDMRLMESKVAMFLMSGISCAMDVDSVLNEGLGDESPSKTSPDSGYTSRSASNGSNCNSAPASLDLIYEKFKDYEQQPKVEAFVVHSSRSEASSPLEEKPRSRLSSVSLPMPIFHQMVDNILNTCLA